jgi:hypothetical protein
LGIELKLKAYGSNVEKLFFVNPNADPKRIRLKLEGANSVRINREGELEAETELGTVTFTKPVDGIGGVCDPTPIAFCNGKRATQIYTSIKFSS